MLVCSGYIKVVLYYGIICYSIAYWGSYRDHGKQNINYYVRFRATMLGGSGGLSKGVGFKV